MATEAQQIISISLGKIANSRIQRGGMSLHKNLLIASVLQRARTVFMEETLTVLNVYSSTETPSSPAEPVVTERLPAERLAANDEQADGDKENSGVGKNEDNDKFTYGGCVEPLVDSDERNNRTWPSARCSKRRRAVSEVEEAVNSILPKKPKADDLTDSYSVSCLDETIPMDVEQISSLVSIFSSSFTGLLSKSETSKISRSLSASDLCATEVKDSIELISMPVLAMTV